MTRAARLRAEQLEARDVPATAFALGTGANANILFRFDTATPGTLQATTPITGLTGGDVVVGTDFRPATGQFYGVGANLANNTVTVYTIDPFSGAAAPIGAPQTVSTIAGAASWGVDFNPVADRIRVVNDLPSDGNTAGSNVNNFRLNPNDGTLLAIDPDLDFSGLPGGNGEAPETAIAYTNSGGGAAPASTTLFGITSGGDRLVTHTTAPGFQTLNSVGPLGVTTATNNAGLDIFGSNNAAVAALRVGTSTGLYTVNTTTGAATLVGPIGDGALAITDVSVAPILAPVLAGGATNGTLQTLVPVAGQLTTGAVVTPFANTGANVRSATGDVNGDGTPDVIAVTGPGTPIRLTVLSGVDNSVLVQPFDPFGGGFTGGGYVAAGDFDADGRAEFIVTPDQGGGPRVTIFSLVNGAAQVRANFFGIDDPNFRGGARAAVGDVNRDGTPDLVVAAGFGGGPRTAIFSGTTLFATPTRLVNDFFAFPGADATTLRNGVFAATSDVDGDGFADLVFGGGPGGAPRVFILSGARVSANDVAGAQANPIANFFVANNTTDRGGVRVAGANIDGDTRGDVVVGSGEGSAAKVRAYRGANFTSANEPATFQDVTVFNGATLPGGVFVG